MRRVSVGVNKQGDQTRPDRAASHRAHAGRVVLFDVDAEGGVAGVSPAPQGGVAFVRLHVAHFFPQVVEAERQPVAGVEETTLTQVAMLCDEDLSGREWQVRKPGLERCPLEKKRLEGWKVPVHRSRLAWQE